MNKDKKVKPDDPELMPPINIPPNPNFMDKIKGGTTTSQIKEITND